MLLARAGKCGFFGANGSSAGGGSAADRPFLADDASPKADAHAAVAEKVPAGAVFRELFAAICTPPTVGDSIYDNRCRGASQPLLADNPRFSLVWPSPLR